MKHLKLLSVFILSICLVSCFDTVEEVEIKGDGSGTYKVNMDLSKAMEMMKGVMINDSDLQKEGMDRPIDTTFNLQSILDTAQNISDHQKELFKDGNVHINMNMQSSVLKLDMKYPFTSFNNMNELYSMIQKGDGGLNQALKSMSKEDLPMDDGSDSPDNINQINSVYDIVLKDGSFSKTLNKERYDAFLRNEKTEQLKGMMSMMGDMNYTLIVKLPRAVKTVSNKLATLSPDKKTITLKSDLFSVFDNPQLMELKAIY